MIKKSSYDYYLILATTAVLFAISVICIYGMFYFKIAEVQQMAPVLKAVYMGKMNSVMAPFLIALVLLLGICVPKRLLPVNWLNWFAGLLVLAAVGVSVGWGIKIGLLVVLFASLVLQIIVLGLAVVGYSGLHFEKKGYWVRLGSSAIHLGLLLFVIDLFYYRMQRLHLFLFWVTTISIVLGMLFCFYSEDVARLFRRLVQKEGTDSEHDK